MGIFEEEDKENGALRRQSAKEITRQTPRVQRPLGSRTWHIDCNTVSSVHTSRVCALCRRACRGMGLASELRPIILEGEKRK